MPLALAALSGTVLASALPARSGAGGLAVLAALVAAALAGAALVLALRRAEPRGRSRSAPRLATALLLASVGVLGAARRLDATAALEAGAASVPELTGGGTPVMLKGRVAGRAARRPGGSVEVPLDVESAVLDDERSSPGGYSVLARIPPGERRRAGDLLPGRRLEIDGRLALAREALAPDARDAREVLAREGLSAVLDARTVWRLGSGSLATPSALAARLARRVSLALHDAALDREPESIVRALLLGERSTLPPSTRSAFVATGTIHVLAPGGLHVALVAALGLALARLLPIPEGARRAVAITGVLAYLFLVGPRPGAVRAAIGAGLYLACGASGRSGDAWNRLAVALLAVLAWDPASPGEASFQLSFGTVAAILGLGRALADARGRRPSTPDPRGSRARALSARARRSLARALASSATAFVAHAPLAVAWFGQLAPVGVVANVVAVPLAALALAPALAGAALGALGLPLATPAFRAAGLASRILLASVDALTHLPLGAVALARPAPVVTALALGLGALGLSLRARSPRPRSGRVCLVAGALLWLAAVVPAPAPREARPRTAAPARARLRVRPGPAGLAALVEPGERAVPLRAGAGRGDPGAGVRVERLALEGPGEAFRIEAGGRAALVLGDVGGAELARLLAAEPEGRLRASVLVAPARPSRALEALVRRTHPLVAIVPATRAGGTVARCLERAGAWPLELARAGAVEIEVGESGVSVTPLR